MGPKSVAIVGAGPSGLVTAKELLQEGHHVVCFEQTDDIGGVFRYRPDADSVGVWQSCRLTSSILVTSFSDYFPGENGVPYAHRHFAHHEYLAYLRSYAEHFGVLPHVRLRSKVVDVSPTPDARWRLVVEDAHGAREVRHVDAVAICSGIHRVPHVPDVPGLGDFRGQVLHAAHYKNVSSLHGKSAVFVGAGESSEIVAEASQVLERSYLSLRRGSFVIPRLLNGLPNDYTGTRLLYSLPDFVSRRSDAAALRLRRRVGIALAPLRGPLITTPRIINWLRRRGPGRADDERWARVEALIEQLRAEAGGNQFETFATKTEAFVEAIVDGRCELRPAIERATRTGVVFTDGSEVDVDVIVFLTGYEPPTVPFLRAPVDVDRLYKRCFDPAFGASLAFIGFLRPTLGSIPSMSELQARWWAQLLDGTVDLPSAGQMRRDADEEIAQRARYHHRVFARLPHLVDYSSYMDDLAELVGCKPCVADLARRPRLLLKVYTGAFCGTQYRLRGPNAAPELAAAVLSHAHAHVQPVRFVDLALAELARAAGSRRFRPRLTLPLTIRPH